MDRKPKQVFFLHYKLYKLFCHWVFFIISCKKLKEMHITKFIILINKLIIFRLTIFTFETYIINAVKNIAPKNLKQRQSSGGAL